jgi:hypothetical protein
MVCQLLEPTTMRSTAMRSTTMRSTAVACRTIADLVSELAKARASRDPGNRLSREIGVAITPSEFSRSSQLVRGLDITAGNADGTQEIPTSGGVIVNADHVVRWVDVHADDAICFKPREILIALDVMA